MNQLHIASRLGAVLLGALLCITSFAKPGDEVPTATRGTHPVAFDAETKIRQSLVQVALAKEPADLIIRGANGLNGYTLLRMPDQDIVVRGKRIAWGGPTGLWQGPCLDL